MSDKKERHECKKCHNGFRTKNKKRELCDDCVRKMSRSKIIKQTEGVIIGHGGLDEPGTLLP